MKPIIRVENLGKEYGIGGSRLPYQTLRESLTEAARKPLAWFRRQRQAADSSFWALKDVSFEVRPGDVVGVVGRNGAGKSTLLKVLSRITEPTTGQVDLYGRVGSLLEVGTGFHPELTGRENIYLNGTILGMRRVEINRRFDEIVAFAEVDQFLDTPVKRYSSGMYVRLAFGVAAHLESEILIVDEVLAVGDAAFQKKCLGKMREVASGGRTVLFVSHNMGAIRGLCNRALMIEEGLIHCNGTVDKVIGRYHESVSAKGNITLSPAAIGSYPLQIERVILKDVAGNSTTSIRLGAGLIVEIQYRALRRLDRPQFWVIIASQYGALLGASMLLDGHCPEEINGQGRLSCVFPQLPLLPQSYSIHLGVRDRDGTMLLTPSMEVGNINVLGSMQDAGFDGVMADVLACDSAPLVLPYEWRLPDGKTVSVTGFTQRGN